MSIRISYTGEIQYNQDKIENPDPRKICDSFICMVCKCIPPFSRLLNTVIGVVCLMILCVILVFTCSSISSTVRFNTSGKHFRVIYTPYTPLLYSKTGIYRGIHYFLIFTLKHILCVFVFAYAKSRFSHEAAHLICQSSHYRKPYLVEGNL